MVGPLREGGGGKGRSIKRRTFFCFCGFPNVRIQISRDYLKTSHKHRGGGGLGHNGTAIKRRTIFLRLP